MGRLRESNVIWMKKSGDKLIPADREATSRIHDMPSEKLVMVSVRQPRNPRFHRMAWGIARLVYDNSERFESAEHVMENLKVAGGLVDRWKIIIPDLGEVEQIRGRSIAFESMDQAEFSEFWEKALDFIAKELMPGVDIEAMLRELD